MSYRSGTTEEDLEKFFGLILEATHGTGNHLRIGQLLGNIFHFTGPGTETNNDIVNRMFHVDNDWLNARVRTWINEHC